MSKYDRLDSIFESSNEGDMPTPVRVDWTKVGEEYVKTPADKAKIEDEMDKLKWESVSNTSTLPFSPGTAIKNIIKDLKLPKVDMIAIGGGFELSVEEGASYGFYGIQATYNDVKIRVHVLDTGASVTPIVIQVFDKGETAA